VILLNSGNNFVINHRRKLKMIPRTPILRFIFGYVWLFAFPAFAASLLFNPIEIKNSVIRGFQAPETGSYDCWIFAQSGAEFQLTINHQLLKCDASTTGPSYFQWYALGKIELQSGIQNTLAVPAPDRLGYLFFTTSAENPKTTHRQTHVFENSPWLLKDRRADEIRNIVSLREFPEYPDLAAWQKRAAELKEHLLFALGLWPLPEKTPLNARVFNRIRYPDYQVEKVVFESYPGFFVTGNLYSPRRYSGKLPAVLCPHGHWSNGRYENTDECSVPGRCINLARQGYVVLSYSMVGFNDSRQLPHQNLSGRASLWGHNLMGLQTWNSIRALDLLLELREVDSQRIGITGASGGGTQTILAAAIDDRLQAAVPVNMVSSIFQGGCDCENAPHLRLDSYNTEIAALFAPKPLLLVCCTRDWTRNNPQVDFPEIQQIYQFFGAPEKIGCEQFDYGHNYNQDSREAMYRWLGHWLGNLPDWQQLKEMPFQVEKTEDLEAIQAHKLPENAVTAEQFETYLVTKEKDFVTRMQPAQANQLPDFNQKMGYLFREALDFSQYPSGKLVKKVVQERGQGTLFLDAFQIDLFAFGTESGPEMIPTLQFRPPNANSNKAVLLVSGRGKHDFFNFETAQPVSLVSDLLKLKIPVFAIDTYGTGEHLLVTQPVAREDQVKNFTTFNLPDLTLRVHDIISALRYLKQQGFENISLLGAGDAGLWCLLAVGLAPELADQLICDANQFENDNDTAFLQKLNISGIRKAGDVTTAAARFAPRPLVIFNTGSQFKTAGIQHYYSLQNAPNAVTSRETTLATAELLEILTR
jgi:dienelactone hydrolase